MKERHDELLDYLAGRMTIDQSKAIESELKSDPQLQQQLAELKDLRRHLELHRKTEKKEEVLRQQLDRFGDKYFAAEQSGAEQSAVQETKVKRMHSSTSGTWKRILMAACLMLFAICATSWWAKNSYTNQNLAHSYWQDLDSSQRSYQGTYHFPQANPNQKDYLEQLVVHTEKAFREKDFEAANQHISAILKRKDDPKYDKKTVNIERLQWNQIVCLLALGKTEQARQAARDLLKTNTSLKYKDLSKNLLKDTDSRFFQWAN